MVGEYKGDYSPMPWMTTQLQTFGCLHQPLEDQCPDNTQQ